MDTTGLEPLLEEARTAAPDRRIEKRDAIAAYGAEGIEAVRPWLADEALAAFAVRVIEKAGVNGEAELAAKVLRAARKTVPEGVAGDVEWALERIRAVRYPKKVPAAAPAAAPRPAPRPTPVNRRRSR